MSDIAELTKKIKEFRDARDWKQFHNPKDIALSLVLEAGEVLEHYQWKNPDQVLEYSKTNKADIGEELADVLYWVLLLAHDLNVDIKRTFLDKLEKSAKKYPIEKSRGVATKYNKL